MKLTICCIALLLLAGCGKPNKSTGEGDTTEIDIADIPDDAPVEEDEGPYARYLSDFDVAHDGYPLIDLTQDNPGTTLHVEYLFEDDNMIWAERTEHQKEGPDGERFLVHRDPEGNEYLKYTLWADSIFGYSVNEFEWEDQFEETMNFVRSNRDKFTLRDGFYTYEDKANKRTYRFSEVLFDSNLLSPTRFDANMIKGYLNWWYPLYPDASGKLYRHQLCNGKEEYIKINAEAGNYRWEEEGGETTLVYLIKGFEESEGDAFYATIERNGTRFRKTLVKPEYDSDSSEDRLLIDGVVYTSEPKKYDVVNLKCD